MAERTSIVQPVAETRAPRLGEVLVARGVILPGQLEEALALQAAAKPAMRLGEILIQRRWASAEDVTLALADMVGVAFRRLTPDMIEASALGTLPRDFMEQHNLLPIAVTDARLTIAVAAFTDVDLLEDIARRCGLHPCVVAATAENIRQTRRVALSSSGAGAAIDAESPEGNLESILGQIGMDEVRVVEPETESDAHLEASAQDSPVVSLVNNIIKNAVRVSASDIHIEPAEATLRVRYRVDGELVQSICPPPRLLPALVSRIKILAGMDISQRRLPQDGGVTVNLFGRSVDLRVSTMATKFGEKVVIRIVDRDAGLRSLDEFDMAEPMLGRLRAVLREPNGIVLVTGPTGSGKSTSLYAALTELRSDRRNISTIEDPVERVVAGVNQFQVHPKAGFTFAAAMRSMLRQDPDVIMVGEIRDAETARLATEASLTGHLVLSTLHTNDTVAAVPRLVNMGIEPYLVAATLRGVLAQRLLGRLCETCVRPVELGEPHRQILEHLGAKLDHSAVAHVADGCAQCGSTGVRGRIGVYDLLVVDETMTTLFDYSKDPRVLRELAARGGSRGLLADGLEKAARAQVGIVSLLEIVGRCTAMEDRIAA
jgi:type II secretory ATPase GspE/PulE/Tfp pilus assembly ATPase PilB-like protein